MPIPETRAQLTDLLTTSFAKLRMELDNSGPGLAKLPCVDDWSVKDLLRAARMETYRSIRKRLDLGVARVLSTIEGLDDTALLSVGVFAWAGKWPVSRWISVNTARQYTTARTFIRRAIGRQGNR